MTSGARQAVAPTPAYAGSSSSSGATGVVTITRRASARTNAMDIAAVAGGEHHAMPIKLRDARPIAGRARQHV